MTTIMLQGGPVYHVDFFAESRLDGDISGIIKSDAGTQLEVFKVLSDPQKTASITRFIEEDGTTETYVGYTRLVSFNILNSGDYEIQLKKP